MNRFLKLTATVAFLLVGTSSLVACTHYHDRPYTGGGYYYHDRHNDRRYDDRRYDRRDGRRYDERRNYSRDGSYDRRRARDERVIIQSSPVYEADEYDDSRHDNRYDRRGYDRRGYDRRGYDRRGTSRSGLVCDSDGDRCYRSRDGYWDYREYYRRHGYRWRDE